MVLTEIDDATNTGVIILRPNKSWSWRANILFLSVFVAISLTISIGFLLAGAWLILPFSIIEISFISGCLYYCVRQCSRQEVITVSRNEVTIEAGMKKPNRRKIFHRAWAKFFVLQPKRPWENTTLSIRSHGQATEIGSFLNRTDKEDLVSHLRRVTPR